MNRPVLRFRVLLLACLLGTLAQSAPAATWYVDKSAAPEGDGTSWATAFQTIQPAIDAASASGGGEVWIADGLYDEVRDPEKGALLLHENVEVYGGFAGGEILRSERDWNINKVVISGEHGLAGGPAVYTVLPESSSRLDGVTVTRASEQGISMQNVNSVTLENIHFLGSDEDVFSRALLARNVSGILVSRCQVEKGKGGSEYSVFDIRYAESSVVVDSVFLTIQVLFWVEPFTCSDAKTSLWKSAFSGITLPSQVEQLALTRLQPHFVMIRGCFRKYETAYFSEIPHRLAEGL